MIVITQIRAAKGPPIIVQRRGQATSPNIAFASDSFNSANFITGTILNWQCNSRRKEIDLCNSV